MSGPQALDLETMATIYLAAALKEQPVPRLAVSPGATTKRTHDKRST
jgi:hypothetical protein